MAAKRDPPVVRPYARARGGPAQIARARNALAQFIRLLLAPRIWFSSRRFSHRAGETHLRRRPTVRQSSTERNRLVDFLGPDCRRDEQESAGGYLSEIVAGAVASPGQASQTEQQPVARNVENRREPGVAAAPNQDAAWRHAAGSGEKRRAGRDGIVVFGTPGS